ncbi:MAG: O-antigen ligase family protein [Candidatus Muirbacterium halophilum]|nr:O-antigen ligase family protein [Candidatus Muirbacterium halophilum]MCK9474641.1 O-antigen ligase family protein [Candidatus Muirbacterium halophilum]
MTLNVLFKKLNFTAEYLVISLFFIQPLSVVATNIITTLIFLIYLISGNYKEKFNKILNNKVCIALLLFFSLFLIGIIWSKNLSMAFYILRKQRRFLLIPILIYYLKNKHKNKYLTGYIMAICVILFLSFLLYFNINLPEKMTYEKSHFTPLHHHVNHNIFIAIGFFIILKRFINNYKSKMNFIYIPLIFIMIINMVLTKGRAGMGVFFIGLFFVCFEYFKLFTFKKILISIILVIISFFVLYEYSIYFNKRVDAGINDIKLYQSNKKYTSLGLRFVFWEVCYEIWKDNKIVGVGQGDFSDEFVFNMKKLYPRMMYWKNNPHSYYFLTIARHGILGLILLFYVFYTMYKYSFNNKKNEFFNFRLFFITSYIFINFFAIYLEDHAASSLFMLWSAFLFNNTIGDFNYEKLG